MAIDHETIVNKMEVVATEAKDHLKQAIAISEVDPEIKGFIRKS
jgi:hypothetical protein